LHNYYTGFCYGVQIKYTVNYGTTWKKMQLTGN